MKKLPTQDIIKQTMIEFSQRLDINEITVGMISDACGIRRETFYYHFKNKEELIQKILYETTTYLQEDLFSDTISFKKSLELSISNVTLKKNFYKKLCEANIEAYGYNTPLSDKFHYAESQEVYSILLKSYKNKNRVDSIGPAEDFSIYFYSHAMVSVFQEWIFDKINFSEKEIVEYLLNCMPENIKYSFI